MPRKCVCDNVEKCRLCWLWHNRSDYRTLWGGDATGMPPPPERPVPQPDCAELGAPLRGQEAVGCSAKLRACALHDQCTTGKELPNIACCRTCPDHTARS